MRHINILGIPHDAYSSFLKGAAEAPAKIRQEFFSNAYNMWTETGLDLELNGGIGSAGDVQFAEEQDPWESIEFAVRDLIRTGEFGIYLGGDHSVTLPILRAYRQNFPHLAVLHFDAHPDIYEEFEGNPRSHACPFARVMEEKLAVRLVQMGIRTATGHQREQWKRYGVESVEMRHWVDRPPIEFSSPVYISLDLDALDPAYAPGVSHREPGGLSPRQIIDVIHSLKAPIVGADIVEYNPRRDFSNVTATVAAKLAKEIAGMMMTNSP